MTEASESLHLVRGCVCSAVGGVLQDPFQPQPGFREPNRGLGQITWLATLKKSAAALGQSEPSSMAKIARRWMGHWALTLSCFWVTVLREFLCGGKMPQSPKALDVPEFVLWQSPTLLWFGLYFLGKRQSADDFVDIVFFFFFFFLSLFCSSKVMYFIYKSSSPSSSCHLYSIENTLSV